MPDRGGHLRGPGQGQGEDSFPERSPGPFRRSNQISHPVDSTRLSSSLASLPHLSPVPPFASSSLPNCPAALAHARRKTDQLEAAEKGLTAIAKEAKGDAKVRKRKHGRRYTSIPTSSLACPPTLSFLRACLNRCVLPNRDMLQVKRAFLQKLTSVVDNIW